MQFQVCPAGDDGKLRTRSRKQYPRGALPANKKHVFKERKISSPVSLTSSLVETSTTEGMDSKEGQRISSQLYKSLCKLGLNPGPAVADMYTDPQRELLYATDRETAIKTIKNRILGPRVPTAGRDTILQVPEYKEPKEIGESRDEVHPPQLVVGPQDTNLRRKAMDLAQPQPKYPLYTLPDQIKRGIQPQVGGRTVGFVPYVKPPEGQEPIPPRTGTPGADLYLPLEEGVALTQMVAWKVPMKSPGGNPMIEMFLDRWQDKYGTNIFFIDEVTGEIYVKRDGALH
ncbi:MAG: hypothetical protein MJE68_26540, partial [Proteobacteria bacterium]|nr:hypothetical protein [Pseudomonadota bacterium]